MSRNLGIVTGSQGGIVLGVQKKGCLVVADAVCQVGREAGRVSQRVWVMQATTRGGKRDGRVSIESVSLGRGFGSEKESKARQRLEDEREGL